MKKEILFRNILLQKNNTNTLIVDISSRRQNFREEGTIPNVEI